MSHEKLNNQADLFGPPSSAVETAGETVASSMEEGDADGDTKSTGVGKKRSHFTI